MAPPRPWAIVGGLVAAALAVAAGAGVARLIDVVSPIDAVARAAIDRTPEWLKTWAIDQFGTDNKRVLRGGIYAVLAVTAGATAIAHGHRRWAAPTAYTVFGVLGAWAAVTRAEQTAAALIPVAIAAVVGAATVDRLVRQQPIEIPGPSVAASGWQRRRFLRGAAVASGAAVVLGTYARASRRAEITELEAERELPLPAAQGATAPGAEIDETTPAATDSTGTVTALRDITPFVTPNDDFYRIDTAPTYPLISSADWQLDISGLVDQPITLTYDELLAMPMIERTITLCCVSNEVGGPYIGNAVWQGVLLKDVLDLAGVQPAAEQVFSTSYDGWTCGFPTSVALDGRDNLVAVGMNGEPLPLDHGFPVRLVVPGLYGYVSATKWLRRIELTTWDEASGYWIPRGWARDAPVKTHSRIDVPRRRDTLAEGPVAIAGVAWAQHRGIAKVEVRIDDGDWRVANLGDDVSDDAWRQWWFDWQATPGEHRLQVRATDNDGETQTEVVAPVAPDGATGYHTRTVTVGG
jgi:DMSO/TMAO reductase YedYZ molybdopterin-dependent catalytic subunit